MTKIPPTIRAVAVAALAIGTLIAGPLRHASAASPALYSAGPSIPVPDGFWDYGSFDPVHNRLYLGREDGVLVLDPATGQVTPHLAPAAFAHQVLPLEHGDLLLVTNGFADKVTFFRAADGHMLSTLPTGHNPDAAIYDPSTGTAVVMNGDSGTVMLIDPAKRAVVATIAVGGNLEYAAADGQGRVFVNVADRNQLAVLDLRRRKVVQRVALAGCSGPTGLAYAPGAQALIAVCGNNVAVVVDANTLRIVKTLRIGGGPDAVVYDAAHQRALIPCGSEGMLDIVDMRTAAGAEVIASIPTEPSARTAALDTTNGKIYLGAATLIPQAVGHPRPKPGTVHILVMTPAP